MTPKHRQTGRRRSPVRLTGRGRGVLLSGVGLLAAGWWSGLSPLVAAGAFALILLAVALLAAVLLRSRSRVRRLDPTTAASVGDRITAAAALQTPGWAPASVIGALTPEWGEPTNAAPRVLLHPGRNPQPATGSFRCTQRGRYRWPDLTMHVPEPFGMAYAAVLDRSAADCLVYPRPIPLPGFAEQAEHPYGAGIDSQPGGSGNLAAGADDLVPRPYRTGDEVRRMHWSATARTGEPMVRTADPGPDQRSAVLLDCRPDAYRSDEGFERAVVVAASLTAAFLRAGHEVCLSSAVGGSLTEARWLIGPGGVPSALAALAEVSADEAGRPGSDRQPEPTTSQWLVTGGSGARAWSDHPARVLATEASPIDGRSAEPLAVWDGSGELTAALLRSRPAVEVR